MIRIASRIVIALLVPILCSAAPPVPLEMSDRPLTPNAAAITAPELLPALSYRIAVTAPTTAVINGARGLDIVSTSSGVPRHFPNPVIVDAAGRPAAGAWIVQQERDSILLRVEVRDRAVRYPITVLTGGTTATRSLRPRANAVGATGSITGVVRNAAGGAISEATAIAFDTGGDFAGAGTTDASGAYEISELPTGSFHVVVFAAEYIAQLYSGISCPDFECDLTAGAPIAVTDGARTAGINFTLASNSALITGHVRGPSGEPLSDVSVVAYDRTGAACGFATSDAAGEYRIAIATGGSFYLRTFNTTHAGLVDQLYSAIPCTSCDVVTGTAVVVSIGQVRSNIDFNLTQGGGRIAGRVTEKGTGLPLPLRRVLIYDLAGLAVSYAETDDAGRYVNFQALAPGSYFAQVSAAGYATQLYDHIDCRTACAVSSGTPITVVAGMTTDNVNFELSNEITTISGFVKTAAGAALSRAFVHFFDQDGRRILSATTDDAGHYTATMPGAGTYFARTQNWQFNQYIDQAYNGVDCSGCPLNSGTPIVVEEGERKLNVNFSLANNGGSITGFLHNASGGAVQGWVQVNGSTGQLATYGFTDANGNYTLIDGLTAGNFFVIGGGTGYSSQIYSNINCTSVCDPRNGNAVPVARGEVRSNINFVLPGESARIAGQIRDTDGDPLGGVDVQVFDASGTQVAVASSDSATGRYEVALPSAGTYFARTHNTAYPQFRDQLYNHLPCTNCDPTTGTPIAASVGTTRSGVDFDLTTGDCNALVVSPPAVPNGNVGVPYEQQISESNGEPPVTFSISTGSLPPGLTLDPTSGLLSGSPTISGSYAFTIRATDAANCSGATAYTIVISAQSTSTSVTVVPASTVYGDGVTMTASVTPSAADGTVSFLDGGSLVATRTLSGGSAALTTSFFGAGTHTLTARYNGGSAYAPSTSSAVTLTVQKATPTIVWATPAPITYATPLSPTQLHATTSVPGSFTYVPATGTILDAGIHTLIATFTPVDTANYNNATASVTIVVDKAAQTISWTQPSDILYGVALTSAQLNATVSVPGPSPAGLLTYSPANGAILDAGLHTLTVSAASTSNYNAATASVTLKVLKATPLFSDLSSPVIVVGEPGTTISGKITAPTAIPGGTVTITVAGSSQEVPIAADGTVTVFFPTGALVPVASGYPIEFNFAGDSNFNSAHDVSTLIVSYDMTGGLIPNSNTKAGATLPLRIQVRDSLGSNLSVSTLAVRLYGVRRKPETTWTPLSAAFRYQNSLGGSYVYELSTKGFAVGTWQIGLLIGSDPTIHIITVTLN